MVVEVGERQQPPGEHGFGPDPTRCRPSSRPSAGGRGTSRALCQESNASSPPGMLRRTGGQERGAMWNRSCKMGKRGGSRGRRRRRRGRRGQRWLFDGRWWVGAGRARCAGSAQQERLDFGRWTLRSGCHRGVIQKANAPPWSVEVVFTPWWGSSIYRFAPT